MPATKTAKRAMDAQAKSSVAKKAKVKMTPVEKKFRFVLQALENKDTVIPGPESCRSMLVAAASSSLQTPKEARHADQDAVFGMFAEIFQAEKSRWEVRITDAKDAFEKASAERTEKMNEREAAQAELKSQDDVVAEKVEAQLKAAEVAEGCKEDVSEALALRGDSQTERDNLGKTQEDHLAVKELLKGLTEGIFENPKELKKHIAAVCALFKGLGAEEALTKTLPQILSRSPSERGSFDEMALQQLDTYMANHLNSLSLKIEGADVILAEHTTAVTAWEAALEVAEDKKRESEEMLQESKTQQEQLQESLNVARKIVKEHTAFEKKCKSNVHLEEAGLFHVDEVLEALEFLREYVPEVEPEEVATESIENAVEVQAVPDDVQGVSVDALIAPVKGKDIDVQMNFDDMPSPSKHGRRSLGAETPVVVA